MFGYGGSMGFVAVFIILQNNIILKSRIIHNEILQGAHGISVHNTLRLEREACHMFMD